MFFIPLFPVNTKYTTQCTFCGATNRLSKDQATQLLRQGHGQAQQPQAQGVFPHPPQA